MYGIAETKIQMFDLLDKKNQNKDWHIKHPLAISLKSAVFNSLKQVKINNNTDIFKLITHCSNAVHSVKIPNSKQYANRGHVVYFLRTVIGKNVAYLLFMDFAGNGIHNIFEKELNPYKLSIRRAETGCIHYGFVQLGMILKEINGKRKISKVVGGGIRHILHPFLKNVDPEITVLFSLSPSNNNHITRNILRFARYTGSVSIKPSKSSIKVDAVHEIKQDLIVLEEQMKENEIFSGKFSEDVDMEECKNCEELKEKVERLKHDLMSKEIEINELSKCFGSIDFSKDLVVKNTLQTTNLVVNDTLRRECNTNLVVNDTLRRECKKLKY
eukprot:188063_1